MVNRRFNNQTFKQNRTIATDMVAMLQEQHVAEQYREKQESLVMTSGSPYLWFQKIFEIPCYCLDRTNISAHENCPTCFGTGFLKSYEKYGYRTFTFAKNWPELEFDKKTLLKGWGYNEVMRGEIVTPFINISSAKGVPLIVADKYFPDGPDPVIEHSYDGISWFDCDVDLSMEEVKFRVQTEGSRFLRVRVRDIAYTDIETNLNLKPDTYIYVSAPEKGSRSTSVENEKIDISDEAAAWSLADIKSGDFILERPRSNTRNTIGIYLINNVMARVTQQRQFEHRRDFTIRYILRNSWGRRFYAIPD